MSDSHSFSQLMLYGNVTYAHLVGETAKWETVDQQGDVPSGREGATLK